MNDVSLLNSWQNFYMIIGTAAATLTGLMFVATTLFAGLDTHESIANAGISAYNTPTVVQFCVVLLLAGILSVPWQTFLPISFVLGSLGLGMVFYLLVTTRRMLRMSHYQTTLEDWLWYVLLPLLANIMLIVAAMILQNNPLLTLYLIGSAMLMLLIVGIRNAWDNVTFLAVKRGTHTHPEDKSREKRLGDSSRRENKMSK